ncbi:MAG TPA: sulfotransferase [Solirubrobacteraceae bacterium]|nr:sulfotransferase [Solirubrobacteraceae bacterium]
MATSTQSQTPAATHTTGSRVPDFFIVGAPKSGTTALFHMLRSHPQIYMPKLKEPNFLASDMGPPEQFADAPRERKFPHTLEEYLALFDDATPAQRAGEASACYLLSRTAAARIAELQPQARIIAILREPASFLRSMHMMLLRLGLESESDLGKAIELESARSKGKRIPSYCYRPQLLQYSQHVRYVDQLRRHHAHFPREQVLALIYDDFRSDNDATVRSVLRFLDVDDAAPIDATNWNETTTTVRSPQARQLVRSLRAPSSPLARAARATIMALTPSDVGRRAKQKFNKRFVKVQAPPPDERTMRELRQRFKPEVVALSEHLDRDLVSLWCEDRVA